MPLYDGPIIDAHHHLWTYAPGAIPWLDGAGSETLARSFAPADYRRAAGELNIVGTVWIEAVAADPLAEAVDATAFHRLDSGLCNALVAHLPLDAPNIEARLNGLREAAPGLRGIRDIVAIRPGHASFARRPDLLASPAFEAGLRTLAEHGLVFDLMLEPWQMGEALVLARRLPNLSIVIEHAGSPDFSSSQGTGLWRDAMRAAAECPNIAVKISALHCRMPDWTDERLAEPILALLDGFGADRLAFASDFPVHDASCPFERAFETFRKAVAGRSPSEQTALFHDTARRLYRI
jgi:predicted TIM-barrel fold metal-dependent hydrolase